MCWLAKTEQSRPGHEHTEHERSDEQVTCNKYTRSRDCNQSNEATSNEKFLYSLPAHSTCRPSSATTDTPSISLFVILIVMLIPSLPGRSPPVFDASAHLELFSSRD